MLSCYNCSSSIDSDAFTTALQAVGDCTVSSDCLTAYNEYFGGWATTVGGEIVVGDLTDETITNFNTKYIPVVEAQNNYAYINWSKATIQLDFNGLVPWNVASIPVQTTLKGFTITEDGTGIKSQNAGMYFLTYSIVCSGPSLTRAISYDFGITGFTSVSPPSKNLYARCYISSTASAGVTLSGSYVGFLTKNAIIALQNASFTSCDARSVSISIRYISP